MFTAFLAIGLNVTATASPGRSKVISNVRSSAVRVGDGLIEQGQLILEKIGYDAKAQPKRVSTVGGAAAASQMDDMRLELIVHDLAENIDKIDTLLSEAQAFPNAAASRDKRKALLERRSEEAVTPGLLPVIAVCR